MSPSPQISLILPGYNEAGNVVPMVKQVRETLMGLGRPFEILYVDDGSTDDSRAQLELVGAEVPELRTFFHRTNFGQSAAILTGIQNSRGDLVITMDSDLQNDPADLPAMISRLESGGFDAVCGIRQKRQDSRMKLLSSRVGNRVRAFLLKDNITDAGCAMRVMRRSALVQLPSFRALHRFLPTILKIHGFEVEEMPICHRARSAGVSKYGVGNRLWVGIGDIIGLRWYRRRFLPPDRVTTAQTENSQE